MEIKDALSIILAVNLMFFLVQISIEHINPNGNITSFFDYDGANSMIGSYDNGNYTLNEDVASELPTSSGQVSPDTGNFFTDIFSTVKNWFLDTTGARYLLNIVNAFPHFLSIIGLPKEFVFALGFFWHAMTVFLIVTFFTGGK